MATNYKRRGEIKGNKLKIQLNVKTRYFSVYKKIALNEVNIIRIFYFYIGEPLSTACRKIEAKSMRGGQASHNNGHK